jgi:hypothetical protein
MPERSQRNEPLSWPQRYLGYGWLLPVALLLGLAPFRPEPHLVEKIRMLIDGTLSRPIDIFDLFLHGMPAVLLVVRVAADVGVRLRGSA